MAGTGGVVSKADGQGAAASFDQRTGATMNTNSNIYVTDHNGPRIKMIKPGGMVAPLAGNTLFISLDGRLLFPFWKP